MKALSFIFLLVAGVLLAGSESEYNWTCDAVYCRQQIDGTR